MIDLASDTVTRPTPSMLEAMMKAPVGDDVLGEDPTVTALEEKSADMFGMEAALFCASGTMTNQIAINVHTRPGDELICHHMAHIYVYEGGGIMANSGVSAKLVGDDDGTLSADQVASAVNPQDIHLPRTRLIAIENTSNKGGGRVLPLDELRAIGELATEHGLAYHLDGARVCNALVAEGSSPSDVGRLFDSISLCLSKGLGCPVGSLLLGERDFVREARRVRKRFGGGWRQAGYLAAAGIHALDHHIERLGEDHAKAERLGECVASRPWTGAVSPVETNIVVFRLADTARTNDFLEQTRERGVRVSHLGGGTLRMVTHLDVSDADIDSACIVLESLDL